MGLRGQQAGSWALRARPAGQVNRPLCQPPGLLLVLGSVHGPRRAPGPRSAPSDGGCGYQVAALWEGRGADGFSLSGHALSAGQVLGLS